MGSHLAKSSVILLRIVSKNDVLSAGAAEEAEAAEAPLTDFLVAIEERRG